MSTSSITVLVIDDDPVELTIISELLLAKGFGVTRASDGDSGIATAGEVRPDVILMDIRMPGDNGIDICRKMKEIAPIAHIPVIFLTGTGREEDVVAGFEAGAVDYVTKPFRSEELLARITTHASISRKLNSYASLLDEQLGRRTFDEAQQHASREILLVRQASEILLERLTDPPSLRELALEIGTNERKLSEVFRRELGMTAFQFLREQRLRQASRLLKGTERPIALIAEQVGYRHSGDFTSAFKQTFGITPREFRKGRAGSREGADSYAPGTGHS